MFDVERVEFLRGPQGTLFGSNSLAGAVRFINKNPDLNEWDSTVLVDWGMTDGDSFRQRYNGVINIPLIKDTLALRLVGFYRDEEGYLYLSDRRVDLIISGGANIYPAEIEAVLTSHPGVRDAAVIGLKDDDLGRRVHAIIEPMDPADPPDQGELDRLCREQLSRYKSPRSYEFLEKLPRNQAGKIRRSSLRDERDARAAH